MGKQPGHTFAFITGARICFDVAAYEAILSLGGRGRPLAWLIRMTPAALSGGMYRWVASHRPLLSTLLAPGAPAPIDGRWYISGGSTDEG